MADAYKVLYVNQLPIAAANLYAPGALKSGIIKNIAIVNQGANTETVTLYLNGIDAAHEWAALVLAPLNSDGNQSEWDGTLPLGPTDFIAGKSSPDATAVTVIITGDEIS